MFSDNTSMLGGAFMGAALGAGGARYGGAFYRGTSRGLGEGMGAFSLARGGRGAASLMSNDARRAWGSVRGGYQDMRSWFGSGINQAVNPIRTNVSKKKSSV